jgi:hypothetical protein
VTVDALRADRVGEDGLAGFTRFGEGALAFSDATSPSPSVRPALAAMFTGQAPDRTGVHDDVRTSLGPELPTLAASLRSEGWQTAAFVGSATVSVGSGLERGFELFDGPAALLPGVEVVENWATWFSTGTGDGRRFSWIHLSDLRGVAVGTSDPEVVARDYGRVLPGIDAALDAVVDAIEASGRPGNVAVILAGTHGVALGEQGRQGDGYWLTDETLRVPLWIRAPGVTAGTSEVPAWSTDLFATVASLSGLPAPLSGDGVDLLAGDPLPTTGRERLAWTWLPGDDLAQAPRTVRWTGSGWSRPDGELEARLARASDARLSDALRSSLEEVGVRVDPSFSVAPPELSAEEFDAVANRLQQVRNHFGRQEIRRAVRRGTLLAESHPNLPATRAILAVIEIVRERIDSARSVSEEFLRAYPDRSEPYHLRGHVALLEGEPRRAAVLFRSAIALGRVEPELHYDLACAQGLNGELDEAFASLRRALAGGYRDWDWFERDRDALPLRADPRYAELFREFGG